MKKLMIAAAIISAAVVSFGAAVEWDAGTITDADGNTAGKNQVYGYLFQITDSSVYDTYAKMSAADLSKAIYKDYNAQISSALATESSSKRGELTLTGIDATAGTPVYAAILYLDDTLGENTYFMGNVATMNWSGTGVPTVSDLANYIGGSGSATAWEVESVPEPFSGALALIGMAGIALRRKMKKAKKA